MTPGLRIGTSGWNYPTGRGTWNGIFYPPARGRPKGFDELAFYASHFNTVEVNSTFYGLPRAEVCRAWAERTPAGFEFSIKLYQKFTHPSFATDKSPVRPEDVEAFKRGIEPLATGGRLGPVLAQAGTMPPDDLKRLHAFQAVWEIVSLELLKDR